MNTTMPLSFAEIAAAAQKTSDGGDLFFDLPAEYAVTIEELAGLEGFQLPDDFEEVCNLTEVTSVRSEGFENGDGLFLRLEVEAVFAYGSNQHPNNVSFVIWVSHEDGGDIEITDVHPPINKTVILDANKLAPVLERLEL